MLMLLSTPTHTCVPPLCYAPKGVGASAARLPRTAGPHRRFGRSLLQPFIYPNYPPDPPYAPDAPYPPGACTVCNAVPPPLLHNFS